MVSRDADAEPLEFPSTDRLRVWIRRHPLIADGSGEAGGDKLERGRPRPREYGSGVAAAPWGLYPAV